MKRINWLFMCAFIYMTYLRARLDWGGGGEGGRVEGRRVELAKNMLILSQI